MSNTNHKAGWFVELPKDLKARFAAVYPGRSAMRKLTTVFVAWAIRVRPNLDTLTDEDVVLKDKIDGSETL